MPNSNRDDLTNGPTDVRQEIEDNRQWSRFGRVLSEPLRSNAKPIVYCRDAEVERLVTNFDHGRHKSTLLLGPSGCGKTAIYYEFFRQLSTRRKPWTIIETSSSRILEGTEYIGQWQTRLFDFITCADASRHIAVFWSGIATAVTAGSGIGSDDNLALAMAPHIESGKLIIFGECTEEMYVKGIKPNPWFERLFSLVRIQPQPETVVKEVVDTVAKVRSDQLREETLLDARWGEDAISALCDFGRIYFPGTAPPGGAINLMDHFISEKRRQVESSELQDSEHTVHYHHIIPTLESLTGVSAKMLDDSQPLHANDIRSFFQQRIMGQPRAINAIVDLIMLIKSGLADPSKPLSVIFLYGPTGVGKTELAKTLAEYLFGSRDRMIRLDMSEYQDEHAVDKIVGLPDYGYNRQTTAGSLLKRVRSQPFSVVLLDEIEKANPEVFDLLLQLFDDGRLSDATGDTTYFTQTIVVMTSNLGGENSEGGSMGFLSNGHPQAEQDEYGELSKFFRPELINRIDRIVKFQPLDREAVRTIARRELGHVLMRNGITRRQLRIDVDPAVIDILARRGFDSRFGARPLKRAVERLALMPLARELAQTATDDRPALIQLLPAGDEITLNVIHDRQSRKSESIRKGIQIENRAGKRTRVKPREIEEALDFLADGVNGLEDECAARDLRTLKSRLVQKSSDVGFWDDPVDAQETMTEIYRIERLLDVIQRLSRRVRGLRERYERTAGEGHDRQMAGIAQEIVSVMKHMEVVGFSLRCNNPLDRSDAFVTITAVEETPQDLVGKLADMYINWSKRKGFDARIVHEELFSPKKTREIIVLIEGVAIVGLLRTEDGLHEFISGQSSRSPQQRHFVNVRVAPILDERQIDERGIRVKKEPSKGRGLRSGRIKATYTATDRESGMEVQLRSALADGEAKRTVVELLNARAHRHEIVQRSTEGKAEQPVIRRYTLSPAQSAKDTRTKVVTHNLRELWEGALDAFLASNVAKRMPTTSKSDG